MRTRFLGIFFLLIMSGLGVRAQYAGTKVEDRLGHRQDSIRNRQFFNDYVKSFQAQDWKACYRPWRELLNRAPFCTFNLTYYGSGGTMMKALMKEEKAPIQRFLYFRDLMDMCDFAIANYKALNSIDDMKHPMYTKGVLMCWKAHFYLTLRDQIPEKAYKKETAYQNFVDAFSQIREESMAADAEMDAFYLEEYFTACRDLYDSDKDKYLEQFLTDYVNCLESCDKMMDVYHDSDTLKWRGYAGARNNIQVYFSRTGAGEAENLVKFYTPRIKENKKNPNYLNNAVHIMFANGCIGEDVFYDACEAAYLIKPNYENCIGMGLMSQDVDNDRVGAKKYFDEARSLATNANEHYLAAKFTADALAKTPAPKKEENESNSAFNERYEEWRNVMRGACIYYNEALDYAAKTSVQGQYLADVYYNLANCYRIAQDYNQALASLNLTKVTYPAFSDERFENMRTSIQTGQENKRKQDEAYRARLANQAQIDAYNRRLAEQRRRQQEEEAFWGKK